MAPCFPGAELWVVEADGDVGVHHTVETDGWSVGSWTNELMRRDVTVLLCSGIDRFLWGALNGYGITVVADALGEPFEVLKRWREGGLVPGEIDAGCVRSRRCRRRRRRGRGV